MSNTVISVGDTRLSLQINDGYLESLGEVKINGTSLRNPTNRFLPWFDAYEGEVFRRFQFKGIETRGEETVLLTRAISDPDTMFRERRDVSGDLIFRDKGWDAAPVEADFRIIFKPIEAQQDDHVFSGFKYGFEYESRDLPIHRLLDRQTWELGGNLNDVTLCVRNWSHDPVIRLSAASNFSTGALKTDTSGVAFPGNLWGRWSLLPAFDFQYGGAGAMVGFFDRVSLIRTLIESSSGEDWLRCLDFHYFEQAAYVQTNPKTVLFCPDPLDEVDALNLWTRVYDQEKEKACRQLGIINERPPQISFDHNVWGGYRFDSSYETVVNVASEFGADYVFIDSVFENGETYRDTLHTLVPESARKGTVLEKCNHGHMCLTLDFEVSQTAGGEEALKRLCDRAGVNGVKVISWIATHIWPRATMMKDRNLGHGTFGLIAAKESGYHPDTGYANDCWPLNLNAPVMESLRDRVLAMCQRTGLGGFLWDSFSNLGWWQVDYSNGTMSPQWDRMTDLYAAWTAAGLLLRPEAMVSFSNHSAVGMVGGNHYPLGVLAGYGYNTAISLPSGEEEDLISGARSIDLLFQWIAHKHVPSFHFQNIPREKWNAGRVQELKELLSVYKRFRHLMLLRTVLKDDKGVFWRNETPEQLFFSFKEQGPFGVMTDAVTGVPVGDSTLRTNRVYLVEGAAI